MLIKKITTGVLVQAFDTETRTFVSQEFVAGDRVDYEDEDGPVKNPSFLKKIIEKIFDATCNQIDELTEEIKKLHLKRSKLIIKLESNPDFDSKLEKYKNSPAVYMRRPWPRSEFMRNSKLEKYENKSYKVDNF